jgi:hypothetical protein
MAAPYCNQPVTGGLAGDHAMQFANPDNFDFMDPVFADINSESDNGYFDPNLPAIPTFGMAHAPVGASPMMQDQRLSPALLHATGPAVQPGLLYPPPFEGPPGSHWHPTIGFFYPIDPQPQDPRLSGAPQLQTPQPVSLPHLFATQILSSPGAMHANRVPHLKERRSHVAPLAPPPLIDELEVSDDDGEPIQKKRNKGPAMPAGRMVSIAQTCVCGSRVEHIPRPRNAFILYRQQKSKELARLAGGKLASQSQISAVAGRAWKSETLEVRKTFQALAVQEATEHARKYPDYKYKPRKGKTPWDIAEDHRFGTPACTCGAYVSNVRKARANGIELDRRIPGEAGYAHAQQQIPVPTASIAAVQATGLAVPGLRRSARRKSSAPLFIEDESATDSLLDLQNQVADEQGLPDVRPRKQRLGAISTPFNSPPAMNTRSKSISHEVVEELSPLTPLPQDAMPDFSDLFSKDFNEEDWAAALTGFSGDADAESIAVQQKRRSTHGSKGSRRTPRSAGLEGNALVRTTERKSPRK